MAVILVVDDEAANRALLRAVLAVDGHEVHLSENGDEALAQLAILDVDLMIVDLFMPVVSGTDLIRRIRRDPARGSLPIALYTGTAVDDTMRDFMAVNRITHIVPKPAEPAEILTVVRGALS